VNFAIKHSTNTVVCILLFANPRSEIFDGIYLEMLDSGNGSCVGWQTHPVSSRSARQRAS